MIEKITVQNAGPLRGFEAALTGANLIIGKNESGKTTLVDLLASRIAENLQGKMPMKEFHKITGTNPQRFGGGWKADFRGSIDVMPSEGAGKETLVDIFSLLVVRANKNEIVNKNEEGISSIEYWKCTVKRMIAGSDEIAKKIGIIRNYTNTQTRIWKIGEALSAYRESLIAKKQDFEAFKRNVSASSSGTDESDAIEKMLDEQKKTRDANEYAKRKKLYTRYMEVRSEIASIEERLTRYNTPELAKKSASWDDCEKRLKEKESRKNALSSEIEKLSERKKGLSASLDEKKKRLDELTRQLYAKKSSAGHALPDASERERLNNERSDAFRAKKKIPLLPVIFMILGVISVTGMILFQPLVFFSLALVLIGILLLILMKSAINKDADRRLKEITDRIIDYESRRNASLMAVANGETDAKRLESELEELRSSISGVESQLKDSLQSIDSYTVQHKRISMEIEAVRVESSAFIAEFKDRINLGGVIEDLKVRERQLQLKKSEIAQLESELKKAFSVDTLIPQDLLARVEREKALVDETYIDECYDPKKFDELQKKRETIMHREHSFDKQFTQMKTDTLKELELSIANVKNLASANMKEFYELFFAGIVGELAVSSMYDLDAAVARCEAAIIKVGMYKQYADFVNQAVREIETKLETIILAVLNDSNFKSMVSKLMGYATMETVINGGTIDFRFGTSGYSLEDLSTGAVHQLNFAFRLALLKKVLVAPSTILLDDAFLHFDHERRMRAVEILKDDLVAQGWQFIYTAIDDNAIEKVFTSVFAKNTLNVIKI